MSDPYNPLAWYWSVQDTNVLTHVFKTENGVDDFVVFADSDYVAWLARGNSPTVIATAAELWQVFHNYAQASWAQSGVDQLSTSVDLTLTNPLKFLSIINESGTSKKVILPCMRSPRAPPIGTPFIVKNDGASTQPFNLYKQDGSTLIDTIWQGTGLSITLTDNTTKNGTLEKTAVFPQGWVTFNPSCVAETGTITSKFGENGAYKRAGDTVFFWAYCVINNPGTGGGALIFQLPGPMWILSGTAPVFQIFPVRLSEAGTNKSGMGHFVPGAGSWNDQIWVRRYDAATAVGPGWGVYISGSYQAA